MKKKNKLEKNRKLRNISDYIIDCTARLRDTADFFLYLGKNKDDFIQSHGGTMRVIISMFDVYSRDAIIIANNILDQDTKTSSLYALLEHIENEGVRKRYKRRIDRLKNDVNAVVQARSNKVSHFNTELNIYENGHFHINQILEMHPNLIKRIARRSEKLLWDMREDLGMEGAGSLFYYKETLKNSFQRLIGKRPKL